jgi:hypothetical protein
MPDALPDATLPISRLGTGSTNGSDNGRGWGREVSGVVSKCEPVFKILLIIS